MTEVHFNDNFHVTSDVTTLHGIFSGDEKLEAIDVSTWDTSKVIDFSDFFTDCKALTDLNLGQWETDSASYYGNFLPWGYEIDGEPWQKLLDPSFAAG